MCDADRQRGLGGTLVWSVDADYDGHSQDLMDAMYNASLARQRARGYADMLRFEELLPTLLSNQAERGITAACIEHNVGGNNASAHSQSGAFF
jgi:hypothetical protein